jgi:hypothetical protein
MILKIIGGEGIDEGWSEGKTVISDCFFVRDPSKPMISRHKLRCKKTLRYASWK